MAKSRKTNYSGDTNKKTVLLCILYDRKGQNTIVLTFK